MKPELSFTVEIPEEAAGILGIDENTIFETYYEDGKLHIRPVEDASDFICDGDCKHCPIDKTDCDENCDDCPCNIFCDEKEEDE